MMTRNGYEVSPGADLSGADFYGASLIDANLRYANLRDADFRNANLYGANLRGANLRGARLRGAHLRGADFRGVDLRNASLPRFQITPVGYVMYGFKKLANGVVATLEIPAEASRTASLVGRKCRAEYVKVVSGEGYDRHTGKVYYKPGEMIYPDKYDDDIRVECTHGIHFFQTYEEAEEY